MSNLTIEVKNDGMLGRLNESNLHIELIKKDKEIEKLKNENKRISKQHIYTLDKLIETQTKIEKAIDWINKNDNTYMNERCYELLEILGGDNE